VKGSVPTIQIFRGDCRPRLRAMPPESIDSFITDPPYGIELGLGYKHARNVVLGDGRREAPRLWAEFLPEAHRLARPDTAHLFFGTWKSIWMRQLLEDSGFDVKGCVVWYKNTWGLGWYLRPRWELIWYCHKGKPPLPDKAPPDVWEHARDHRPRHPCQKPVELLRRAVRFTCPARGTVCDPFAGIFSTAVAAALEGRSFIGMERDPRYVKLGRARVAAALNPP
jgi:DNA modification methylase